MTNCKRQSVVEFDAISSETIAIEQTDLSTDQMYLFEIYQAVLCGDCSQSLALRNLTKMAHYRWLTTANRILCLHISEDEPSETIVDIVNYIMKVYAPLWFGIMKMIHFIEGAKYFHKMLSSSRKFE